MPKLHNVTIVAIASQYDEASLVNTIEKYYSNELRLVYYSIDKYLAENNFGYRFDTTIQSFIPNTGEYWVNGYVNTVFELAEIYKDPSISTIIIIPYNSDIINHMNSRNVPHTIFTLNLLHKILNIDYIP